MSERKAWVYILTNFTKTVLYIGITSDISRRMQEHRDGSVPGFTSKYNCKQLVYLEEYEYISHAINREKELKAWRREKKDKLINLENPDWNDLFETIIIDT
jgi:putative endonuclease